MLDLENVKGILISPKGEYRSFGVYKKASIDEMIDENYHDSAFKNDILNTPWFKELEEELGFVYDEYNIHRQSIKLASKGIVVMLNGSTYNPDSTEYNLYTIQVPQVITQQQEQILSENYIYLKQLIEKTGAYFEGNAYDREENYLWNDIVYDIDTFYDLMNIEKTKNIVR